MTTYDFETILERRNTGCLKWDAWEARGHAKDDLPLWVADMDFRTVPEALDALHERVSHGVFGYTMATDAYYNAVISWFESRHNWALKRPWFVLTPGVVFALACAINAYTRPGDAVVIQPPVYYPFRMMIEDNGRQVAASPLLYDGEGRYTMDYEGFERTLVETGAKLFILCNPHNPVGRCWSAEELRRIGDICLAHNVVVVADEIHADFACEGFTHTPYASLGDAYAANAVICTAPSKTFNLAGLQISNIIIPNPELRHAFKAARGRTGYDEPSVMGVVATQACYEHGAPWLDQLKRKLDENLHVLQAAVDETPGLRLVPLESTYLPWIDCRALGLSDAELKDLVEKKAGLWLDLGTMFGDEGTGFIRMNLASPTPLVQEACTRLQNAIKTVTG